MNIAIVGLGQIGGSMALRLKNIGINPTLFDVNKEICSQLNANCGKFSGTYDLVILALHIPDLLKMMGKLPPQNLYLDTASVKWQVVEKARKSGLKFVGGHPIAGNEKKGIQAWDVNLFEGKPFALVKANCSPKDEKRVEEFVKLLGAIPIWTTAQEHDLALAYTSHAPYFVSLAVKAVGEKHEKFAGPGYASMTRLSKQDSKLGDTFINYNSKNVSVALRSIANEILKIADEVKRCGDLE